MITCGACNKYTALLCIVNASLLSIMVNETLSCYQTIWHIVQEQLDLSVAIILSGSSGVLFSLRKHPSSVGEITSFGRSGA